MGSEMCIRDRCCDSGQRTDGQRRGVACGRQVRDVVDDDGEQGSVCLLYTSDAADERSSVDLGGRRIIKKKTQQDM